MDAELDTGNVLAQERVPLGDEHGWEELTPKLATAVGSLLPAVLERVAAGDPGDPQDEGEASYFRLFEPEYAWIDSSQSADEVERQVRAWRFHSGVPGERGALTERRRRDRPRAPREPRCRPTAARCQCADGTLWIVESEAA